MAAITIYTTPTCAFCHMAKEYFKSKNIEFEAKDVTSDAAAFKEFQELEAGMGVPVINIDGKIIVGFDRPNIDLTLREKGLV
ncbi:MAG TPA: glutaredoxin domain-containing protein [Candidatus Saccharimonadales bacterium]|jgi:glutaredoxin-like YruB-family protein